MYNVAMTADWLPIIDEEIIASSGSLKTDLFIRINHMDKMSVELRKVLALNLTARKKWSKQNGKFLRQVMDEFLQDSTIALEAVDGDDQAMSLSVEYVSKLRDVMSIITNLLDTDTNV